MRHILLCILRIRPTDKHMPALIVNTYFHWRHSIVTWRPINHISLSSSSLLLLLARYCSTVIVGEHQLHRYIYIAVITNIIIRRSVVTYSSKSIAAARLILLQRIASPTNWERTRARFTDADLHLLELGEDWQQIVGMDVLNWSKTLPKNKEKDTKRNNNMYSPCSADNTQDRKMSDTRLTQRQELSNASGKTVEHISSCGTNT